MLNSRFSTFFILLAIILAVSALLVGVIAAQDDDDEEPVGAVYAMTNSSDGNEIVIYNRAAKGALTLAGTIATEGLGADALGSQNPLILSHDNRFLFAVNAGSNTISVFRVRPDGLTLVDVEESRGEFPVSLTVSHYLLYVLNAGGDGNITGFTISDSGQLTLLEGSTRSLGAEGPNPPRDSSTSTSVSPSGLTRKDELLYQSHLSGWSRNRLLCE